MRVAVGGGPRVVPGAAFPVPPAGAPTVVVERVRPSAPPLSTPSVTIAGVVPLISLTASHVADLDVLTVTVTADAMVSVTRIEVCDEVLPLPALRADPALSDRGRVPDGQLIASRDGLLRLAEEFVGSLIGAQLVSETAVTAGRLLALCAARPVSALVAAAVDDETVPVADVEIVDADAGVLLVPEAGRWTVWVEAGMRAPASLIGPLMRAVRRDVTTRAALPADALWQAQDGVTLRFSTADFAAGRPTGVMDLDAVLVGMRGAAGVA